MRARRSGSGEAVRRVVEEHVQQDAGETPALQREAPLGRMHQWVAVGEGVDAPVQLDGPLDLVRPLSLQAALDEVAVQAAEQLGRLRAAEVEMREVVHVG